MTISPVNPLIGVAVTVNAGAPPRFVVANGGVTDIPKSCTIRAGQLLVTELDPFVTVTLSLNMPPTLGV